MLPMPEDYSPDIEIRNTMSTYEALIICSDGDITCGLLWNQINMVLADLPYAFLSLKRSVWQAKCEGGAKAIQINTA